MTFAIEIYTAQTEVSFRKITFNVSENREDRLQALQSSIDLVLIEYIRKCCNAYEILMEYIPLIKTIY